MDPKRLDSRCFPLVLDEEVLGRRRDSIFRTSLCKTVCALRRSIAAGEMAHNGRVRIHRSTLLRKMRRHGLLSPGDGP